MTKGIPYRDASKVTVDTSQRSGDYLNVLVGDTQYLVRDSDDLFGEIIEYCSSRGVDMTFIRSESEKQSGPVLVGHPVFNMPPDEAVVWRYMPVDRFIQLYRENYLWFGRVDTYKAEDPHEAWVPVKQQELEEVQRKSQNWGYRKQGNVIISGDELAKESYRLFEQLLEARDYNTYINCWHRSEIENFAMWKIYGRSHDCVAIRTTIGDLRNALGEDRGYSLYGGNLNYIDYKNDVFSEEAQHNLWAKYIHKSHFFKYEKEFRLLFNDNGSKTPLLDGAPYFMQPTDEEIDQISKGIKVPCDFNRLNARILIGPQFPDESLEKLRSNMNKSNFESVAKSEIAKLHL